VVTIGNAKIPDSIKAAFITGSRRPMNVGTLSDIRLPLPRRIAYVDGVPSRREVLRCAGCRLRRSARDWGFRDLPSTTTTTKTSFLPT